MANRGMEYELLSSSDEGARTRPGQARGRHIQIGVAVVVLLLLYCFLVGLGDSMDGTTAKESSATPTLMTDDSRTTYSLILMRHCVRGSPNQDAMKIVIDGELMKFDANFFGPRPFPYESVSEEQNCLPRGLQLLEAQGKWIKTMGGLTAPVRSISDTDSREVDTTASFFKGLGLGNNGAVNHQLFVQSKPSLNCQIHWPSSSQMMSSAHMHLQANPPPPGYYEAMHEMYEALGNISVGDWTGVPCTQVPVGRGHLPYPAGNCNIASSLWERFMMQWAGGLEIAWGLFDQDKVIRFSVLHSYWLWLMWGVDKMSEFLGPSLSAMVAARFEVANKGTDLLVGHDTNMIMLKSALGLIWEPKPFAANSTLPGSWLRFDRQGTKIKASYWYVENFSKLDGTMISVPARFASTGSDTITSEHFNDLLMKVASSPCAIDVKGIKMVPALDVLMRDRPDIFSPSSDVG